MSPPPLPPERRRTGGQVAQVLVVVWILANLAAAAYWSATGTFWPSVVLSVLGVIAVVVALLDARSRGQRTGDRSTAVLRTLFADRMSDSEEAAGRSRLGRAKAPLSDLKFFGVIALAAVAAFVLGVVASRANRLAAGVAMAVLGGYAASVLLAPPKDYPDSEGGFYPVGLMPLILLAVLVDAVAAVAGAGPLLEWSPGVAGLPIAAALAVAEYRRWSTWRRRHNGLGS
jgi:peptidoglycan/LPS O-acetylase OafA/YrhL